jgi:hypothetical protein
MWENYLVTFTDMAILPGGEVWAIGQRGIIVHERAYIAHLTNRFDYPGEFNDDLCLAAVAFLAPDDGWLTGCGGRILHWDGQAWSTVVPFGFDRPNLVDLGFANPNLGWAVGRYWDSDSSRAALMQWDGKTWENITLPATINQAYGLVDVEVLSETDVWVVGDAYQSGLVLHWDGAAWQAIPTPPELTGGNDIGAAGPADVWVLDEDRIFHWDGAAWRQADLPVGFWYSESDSSGPDILALAPDDVWVGGRALFHWDGVGWRDMKYYAETSGPIVDLEMDADGNIWALTLLGATLRLFNR